MRPSTILALIAVAILLSCAPQRPVIPGTSLEGDALADDAESEVLVLVPLRGPESARVLANVLMGEYPLRIRRQWPMRSIDRYCFVFRVNAGSDIAAVLDQLNADGRVRLAQRMNLFRLAATGKTPFDSIAVTERYDDPLLHEQHGLRAINALRAQQGATGRNVVIGLVDTGVERGHPDLRGQVTGRDFVGDGVTDGEPHGTALAGVIAAKARNGFGTVGVAPDARILSLRGCWQNGPRAEGVCTSFTLARAINFALQRNVDVLNLSLQGPPDPLLRALLTTAIADGVIVVAAYTPNPSADFPASMAGVIAVGKPDGIAPARTNFPLLHAPGRDILATAPGKRHDFFSGSSLAAAHVSGVVALLRERTPDLILNDIKAALQQSLRSGKASVSADNIVNACQALLASTASAGDPLSLTCS